MHVSLTRLEARGKVNEHSPIDELAKSILVDRLATGDFMSGNVDMGPVVTSDHKLGVAGVRPLSLDPCWDYSDLWSRICRIATPNSLMG